LQIIIFNKTRVKGSPSSTKHDSEKRNLSATIEDVTFKQEDDEEEPCRGKDRNFKATATGAYGVEEPANVTGTAASLGRVELALENPRSGSEYAITEALPQNALQTTLSGGSTTGNEPSRYQPAHYNEDLVSTTGNLIHCNNFIRWEQQ
jgi:hypothetical protein